MARYNPKDHFFHKAKKENFVARSVYKLEEIQEKYKIIKTGHRVLDLGAAPGSWTQYTLKAVGPRGLVVAIDLSPLTIDQSQPIKNLVELTEDANNLPQLLTERELPQDFDVVISDMAPKTTGVKFTDQVRSYELCELALNLAKAHLKKGGSFVCKFFHSADFKDLHLELRKSFEAVHTIKPEATRSMSKEIFIVGRNKKAPPTSR